MCGTGWILCDVALLQTQAPLRSLTVEAANPCHSTQLKPAGPAAWRAVTLAWAAKLEQQLGEPHLAALHLLAVQEVEGAVQVGSFVGCCGGSRRLLRGPVRGGCGGQ